MIKEQSKSNNDNRKDNVERRYAYHVRLRKVKSSHPTGDRRRHTGRIRPQVRDHPAASQQTHERGQAGKAVQNDTRKLASCTEASYDELLVICGYVEPYHAPAETSGRTAGGPERTGDGDRIQRK